MLPLKFSSLFLPLAHKSNTVKLAQLSIWDIAHIGPHQDNSQKLLEDFVKCLLFLPLNSRKILHKWMMLYTNKGNNVELNNSKHACYLHTKRCQPLDPKSGYSHLPFSSYFDVIISFNILHARGPFLERPSNFSSATWCNKNLICTLLNIPIMRFLWFVIEQTQLIVNRS